MRWSGVPLLVTMMALVAVLEACGPSKPPPADVDAYVKARDLYLRGAVDQAGELVSHIDSRTRGFHQARLLEGKIFFFKGEMQESEKLFRGLVRQFAGYTEAQLWLIRSLQAQDKTQEAESLLNAVLELNPGDPRFLHQAGMLRLRGDDIRGALAFFRRSQEFSAELSQSYIESARILYRFGMTEAALTDLGTARVLLPSDSGMRKPVEDLEKRVREAKK